MSRWWMHAACAALLALVGTASAQQSPAPLPALEARMGRTVTIVEPQQPTEKATVVQVWRQADGTPCMLAQSTVEPKQFFTLVENTTSTSPLDRIKVHRWSTEGVPPAGCPKTPAKAEEKVVAATKVTTPVVKVDTSKVDMTPLSKTKVPALPKMEETKSTLVDMKNSTASTIKTVKAEVNGAAQTVVPAVANKTKEVAKTASTTVTEAAKATTTQASKVIQPVAAQTMSMAKSINSTDLPNLPASARKISGGREVMTITTADGKARDVAIVGQANGEIRCQALDNGEYITLQSEGSIALPRTTAAVTPAPVMSAPVTTITQTSMLPQSAPVQSKPAAAAPVHVAPAAPVVTTGNCDNVKPVCPPKVECAPVKECKTVVKTDCNDCGKSNCDTCKGGLQRRTCEKDCDKGCDTDKCKTGRVRQTDCNDCNAPGGLFANLYGCNNDLLSTINSEGRCHIANRFANHNHNLFKNSTGNCDGSACSSGVCTGGQLPLQCCDVEGGILDQLKCAGSMINVPVPGLNLGSFNGIPNGPPAQPIAPAFCTINSTSIQRHLCASELRPFACLYQPFSPCMIDQINRGMNQVHGWEHAEAIRNTCYLISVLQNSNDMANREWAAQRLATADVPAMKLTVQDALVKAAANDRAPMVRVAAMKSIASIKLTTPAAMAALFKNTQDTDPRVRENAVLLTNELHGLPPQKPVQQAGYVQVVR